MSCADHKAAEHDLESELERLVREGYLTQNQAQSIDRKAVLCYYRSGLFQANQSFVPCSSGSLRSRDSWEKRNWKA